MTRTRGPIPRVVGLTAAALWLLTAHAGVAEARDCPSLLAGHLFNIRDRLEIGAEIRAFYFGMSVGDDMPTSAADGSRAFENNFFWGLRTLVYWYPADGLSIGLEDELRYRYPGWEDHAASGLDHRPVQLFVEYDRRESRISVGLQPFTFGTAAVLDQRFFGVAYRYQLRDSFTFEAFGGTTADHYMRNANNTMWSRYQQDTNGWKRASETLTRSGAAGMTLSLRNVRPFRLQALYLFSRPVAEELRSHVVALHFAGPILRPYLSFLLEPMVMIDHENRALPALVGELRVRAGAGRRAPMFALGGASAFRHRADRRFASVFENYSAGTLRRFNLYQGHIVFGRASWQVVDQVRLFARYTAALPGGNVSDELDLGTELKINDLFRLNLDYIGLNLAGDGAPSHSVRVEARIILGR